MVKNRYIYKIMKKHFTIFFKETILYLFVRFSDTPKDFYSNMRTYVARYFDVCPEYWYYHSFINKLKDC